MQDERPRGLGGRDLALDGGRGGAQRVAHVHEVRALELFRLRRGVVV